MMLFFRYIICIHCLISKGDTRLWQKDLKWYYRFYVEDASGNLVQKEYAGTESKSETEKLLRQAVSDMMVQGTRISSDQPRGRK